MKQMGRFAFVAVAILVVALAFSFSGCSSGGSSSGGGGVASITTSTQGAQAASSSVQGASMAQGTGQTFQNLGNIGLSSIGAGAPVFKPSNAFKPTGGLAKALSMSAKFAKSPAAKAAAVAIKKSISAAKYLATTSLATALTGSVPCADSGNITYSLTSTSSGFTGDLTFNSCREDDSQYDGVYHMDVSATASSANMTEALGSATQAFTMLDFSTGYAALVSKATMTALTIGINITGLNSSTMNLTETASGGMDIHDYLTAEDFALTFTNNFTNALVVSIPTSTSTTDSIIFTANGDFSETYTSGTGASAVTQGLAASYQNMQIQDTFTSTGDDDETLSGQFTITFTPASCLNGTFAFVTNTAIHYSNSAGHTTAGSVTINGATTIVWNADGSITVTTGGVATHYNGEYDLSQECPMATMDEQTPVSSGSTGTASASGAAMTITLGWNKTGDPSSSDADMDLHLKYYSVAAPTASTPAAWLIDWNLSGPGESCTLPSGTDSARNQYDFTGDGICDAILDIDNTSGFGPEHITTTSIPAGYYVVSVDSYSMYDTSEDVQITIQIGSSLFGPFTHTFTTSDTEGTDPNSWFAAADIVVDSSGNATVQAHDTNLAPWDSTNSAGLYTARGLKIK